MGQNLDAFIAKWAAAGPSQELTPNHQAKRRSARRRGVVKRWVDILFAGSVGAAIVDLLVYWHPGFFGKIVASPSWVFLAGGLCVFAFASRFGRGRWLAFLGLRHPLTYPPVWLGATFGTAAVALTLPAISDRAWNAACQQEELSWQQGLKGALPSEELQRPVELLVEFLFGQKRQTDSPQSVMQNNHANYWERFFKVPTLQTSERDQPILRVMQASDDEALISLLEDPSCDRAVHDFRRLLPADRPIRLFLPLIFRRSKESATAWTRGDHDPPGLIVLWRLLLRQMETGNLTGEAMLEQVRLALDLAIPANLALASSIVHHFVTFSLETQFFNDEQKEEAKTYLRTNLVSVYQGKAKQMAGNLLGAEPHVLYWLCWGLDRVRAKSFEGLPFEGWEQLAPIILEAARLNPRVMIPQLSFLLVKTSVSRRSTDYEFDSDLATRLFTKAGNLREVFEKQDESQWPTSPMVQAVISGLKKLFEASDRPLDLAEH